MSPEHPTRARCGARRQYIAPTRGPQQFRACRTQDVRHDTSRPFAPSALAEPRPARPVLAGRPGPDPDGPEPALAQCRGLSRHPAPGPGRRSRHGAQRPAGCLRPHRGAGQQLRLHAVRHRRRRGQRHPHQAAILRTRLGPHQHRLLRRQRAGRCQRPGHGALPHRRSGAARPAGHHGGSLVGERRRGARPGLLQQQQRQQRQRTRLRDAVGQRLRRPGLRQQRGQPLPGCRQQLRRHPDQRPGRERRPGDAGAFCLRGLEPGLPADVDACGRERHGRRGRRLHRLSRRCRLLAHAALGRHQPGAGQQRPGPEPVERAVRAGGGPAGGRRARARPLGPAGQRAAGIGLASPPAAASGAGT